MQNSEESECRLVHTQNGLFVKSPNSKSFDLGILTPQKLPAAPHPSPINMDIESCNPNSKEMFRTELLKACLLKIPEAVANESVFNDYLSTKPSSTYEVSIPDMADSPQGQCLLRLHKKAKLESDLIAGGKIQTDADAISNVKDSQDDLNHKQCSKLCENVNLEYSLDESTSGNINDFGGKNECSGNLCSFHFGNNDWVEPPCINENIADSFNGKDGTEQFHNHGINCLAYYDHITDHQEISRLFNVNSEKNEHSYSILGGRSSCSDNMSTIAVCASDASDISDEDLSTRSMELRDMERSTDRPSNPKKKKSTSAVRRFLNWRKTLKIRKRAASLDESRFPFLANRFDSYKTEFELSV